MELKLHKKTKRPARALEAEICSIELSIRELELRKSLLAVELKHARATVQKQSILYPQAA